MADIDLGFPEERNREWLTNRYFPSKVGGRPAWLELDNLPKEKLECGKCKTQKSFLCQVYASYDDEHNFHRTIYVFICRTPSCQEANSAKNFTVLRSQLPRKNDFYSEEAPLEDGDPLPSIAPKSKLCLACGCVGPMCCARCKKANYCSVQHQRAHWPHHKKLCTADSTLEEIVNQSAHVVLSGIRFPEWEILIEPNDEEEEEAAAAKSNAKDDEASEQKRLATYEKLVAEGKAGELKDIPDSELDKYACSSDGVDDKDFSKFRKEVSKEPEQILRYKRNGQPLWIAPVNECVKSQLEIPICETCGGQRQFEFQIMPQMLLLLDDEQPDWGVLAVYTCASSCKLPAGVGYVDEYIVKQDILVNKI